MAKDPVTGACWIILRGPGGGGNANPGPRDLAIINPKTARADVAGDTGVPFAGIAFDNNTLYGLTGDQDGDAIPTIYTINKISGTPTLFLEMVNTDDGEALGSIQNRGLLYRMNGREDLQVFESIDPSTKAVTEIPL